MGFTYENKKISFNLLTLRDVSPTKMIIRKYVKKYKTEGSSLNLYKARSGRKRTEPTQENINLLQ